MKQNMILLHGLFGQLSNWDSVVEQLSTAYRKGGHFLRVGKVARYAALVLSAQFKYSLPATTKARRS